MTKPEEQAAVEDAGYYQLRYAEAWPELLKSPEKAQFQKDFTTLVDLSEVRLLDLPDIPDWVNDKHEIIYRWQQMLELAAMKVLQGKSVRGQREKDIDSVALLEEAMSELRTCIDERGWAQEGIVLDLPLNGFGEDTSEEFDIRQMGPVVSVIDMEFDEFKALSDEEVEEIVERYKKIAEEKRVTFGSIFRYPPHGQIWEDGDKLGKYLEWRKYGKPDRELTSEEELDYLKELVEYQTQKDPEYGKLPAEFDNLDPKVQENVAWVFEYFNNMRDLGEILAIDTYSLCQTIGLEEGDVQGLVDNNILVPVGERTHYRLADRYLEFYLVAEVQALAKES
jgi:hypothetical protein